MYKAIRDGKFDTLFIPPTSQIPRVQLAQAKASRRVFVARQAEIEKLGVSFMSALDGNGSVVFVVGSAGSGKSALIDEVVQRALRAHRNLIAAPGRCNAYTGLGDPYIPFLEILGLLTGDLEAEISSGALSNQSARRLQALQPAAIQALVEVGPDPVRVEAVIAECMGRLPQELRRLLEVASVEGEEFTAEVIADVLVSDEGILIRQLSEQLERRHRLVNAFTLEAWPKRSRFSARLLGLLVSEATAYHLPLEGSPP